MSTARRFRAFHLCATGFWLSMVVPTVLWWHDSILWVAFMSIWANVATHWGAWQASRAEVASIETERADVHAETAVVETP